MGEIAGAYATEYAASVDEPNEFWLQQARSITWTREPVDALDATRAPHYRWFPDGELNTCANALDRHVDAGRGAQAALIYDSPVTGTARTFTYRELLDDVAVFAGALRGLGVTKGDRVVIYMPMVPEAVVAMLACARLGAIHSVVFGGFAAAELASRIDDAQPTVVVSASCGIEPTRVVAYKPLLDQALALSSHKPRACVILQREQLAAELHHGRDIDWVTAILGAQPVDPVPVAATDPLYVLYTSGTTGKPKGVVRDNGGHAVALSWSMRNVYDVDAGDVFWAASDIGWVVGHSYIVYGPLLVGATTVLYEGKPVGTPDPGAFWRVVEQHGVKALFTAPTALRAVRKEDPNAAHLAHYNVATLRYVFLAGERLDPDTFHWATTKLDVPVIDHWWQTETGWAIAANFMGLEPMPIKPGSPTVPAPGYRVAILRPDGIRCDEGEEGSVCIELPLPPGAFQTLWNDEERYISSYLKAFPGYYLSGDSGYLDNDGYLFVMGRTDDVINVAGHRLSTGSMEAVIAAHPAVAECAVIAVADPLKGHVPRAFAVLTAGVDVDHSQLRDELVAAIREQIGPVAALRLVDVVPALPKTRSGKILRKTMRAIADGRNEPIPSTIEDASALDQLRPILRQS